MKIGDNIQANCMNYNFRQKGSGNSQDAQLKAIRNQISIVQKQIQGLSENKTMSAEQKMDKRKELEQQLQDLNKQAMQRQIEIQKEQIEQKVKQQGSTQNQKKSDSGSIGSAAMQGIISADTTMSQAKTIGAEKKKMEGQAGVLGIEIKLDSARGFSVGGKEAKLADLQDRISNAGSNIMGKISDVNKTLKESGKSTEDKIDKKENDKEKNTDKKVSDSETNLVKNENGLNKEETLTAEVKQNDMNQKARYESIDIKL